MGFQIKTKEGDSLELRLLDQEAANFWGVEVDPKYYASPVKKLVKPESFANEEEKREWRRKEFDNERDMLGSNWYDRIGYIIHRGKTTWKDV